MRAVKENAYAKINLFLDVTGKRDDGFHSIKSIMHSVSLADVITVSVNNAKSTSIKITAIGNNHIPTDERNLAYKAAELFLSEAGINAGVEIKLVKNIPVCAGLAGGSTDAAATLRALNRIYGRIFGERAMLRMAESLGSDVPYCLLGKTALCEGRGELITQLNSNLSLIGVVAVLNEFVSTPMAYGKLDKMFSDFDGSVSTGGHKKFDLVYEAVQKGISPASHLFNVFEEAVLPSCPGAAMIKEKMVKMGASASLMSGSGPSVFGLFESEGEAIMCESELRKMGVNAFFVRSV